MRQTKDIKFQLRLTQAESAMLEAQASSAGMTKTRYVTYLIEREHKARQAVQDLTATPGNCHVVIVYKDADLRKIIWHLSKWGNNLNQAAYALNALAGKSFISRERARDILQHALDRIERSEAAIVRIAENIGRLRDEPYIVVGK